MIEKITRTLLKESDFRRPDEYNTHEGLNAEEVVKELGKIEELILEPDVENIKIKSIESIMEENKKYIAEIGAIKEDETRHLSEEEKVYYQEKINMSDSTLEKCTIDENGTIYVKGINEDLEGKTNGVTNVEYKRKTIEINGVKIEVVVPEFKSVFEVQLSEDNVLSRDDVQSKECNSKLSEAVNDNPDLKNEFSEEQLEMIEKRYTPRGFTWHHDVNKGEMKLVTTNEHSNTRHTGGKAIWGGGKENR